MLLHKMVEVLYGKKPDFRQIRKDTGIPVSLLRSLLAPADSATPSSVVMLPEKQSKQA
jgi:hypothetical protein